jgi:hypothetical protein
MLNARRKKDRKLRNDCVNNRAVWYFLAGHWHGWGQSPEALAVLAISRAAAAILPSRPGFSDLQWSHLGR